MTALDVVLRPAKEMIFRSVGVAVVDEVYQVVGHVSGAVDVAEVASVCLAKQHCQQDVPEELRKDTDCPKEANLVSH